MTSNAPAITAAPAAAATPPRLVSPAGWVWIATLAALFVLLFNSWLIYMVRVATNAVGTHWLEVIPDALRQKWSPDWSHTLIIPLLSLYYVFLKRDELARTPRRIFWPALALLLLGIFGYMFWIFPGRNMQMQGYALILTLGGLLWFLLGTRAMGILWFPVAYLVFAVKVSDRIWEQIAWEMQRIASHSAGITLALVSPFTGISAEITGSTIELFRGVQSLGSLNVAEACSGLRMLMAFLALGVAMAFLFDRPWWQRLVMCALTVPVAIAVNVGRVTALGVLYPINKDLASGDFHTFVGLLMLLPAAGLYLLLGWIMDHLIIRDDTAAAPARASSTATPIAAADACGLAPSAAAPARPAALGAAAGALLALLLGGAYWLALASYRPNLLPSFLSPAVAGAIAAVAVALALVVVVAVVWFAGWRTRLGPLPLGLSAGVLLVAASGLFGVVNVTKAALTYLHIELRRPVFSIPDTIKTWKKVHEDPPLTGEILETLGTRDYISRVYRDLSLPEGDPAGLARVHVAYYTGNPDTVPHVPDRCYVAGGVAPIGKDTVRLDVAASGYVTDEQGHTTALSQLHGGPVRIPTTAVPATRFTFAGRTGDQASNVLYFFAANGRFFATPDGVRLQGFDIRDRYSYYCKIEVGFFGVEDPQVARQRTADLLTALLPEIMAVLPDWTEVQEGRWPAPDTR